MTDLGTTSEDKRKHLEFIQGVINRMASNSFLFKGWSITIIAAISAFATKDANPMLMVVPIVSTILFWSVDAFYLLLERNFRNVYNAVAIKPVNEIDFKLTPEKTTTGAWLKVMFGRPILYLFYGAVLIMLIVLTLLLNNIGVEVKITHGA